MPTSQILSILAILPSRHARFAQPSSLPGRKHATQTYRLRGVRVASVVRIVRFYQLIDFSSTRIRDYSSQIFVRLPGPTSFFSFPDYFSFLDIISSLDFLYLLNFSIFFVGHILMNPLCWVISSTALLMRFSTRRLSCSDILFQDLPLFSLIPAAYIALLPQPHSCNAPLCQDALVLTYFPPNTAQCREYVQRVILMT
ncbi:hypothetical protein M501DRAFT_170647 [Patellaria atrata CBS 101060]|uniref:Uncharacterized protein n=1 Tax=Patellaria atrata CBS 101060 TaxID=1346257 RepID=A0A9P4S7F1_9PEZI|nr:hypothetical protein M501DRAFT_170647 [Patellaria atrata CBS 101060]